VLVNDIPYELVPGDSKGALLRVQPNVEPLEVVEGFFYVRDEVVTLSRFCDDVIDIDLKVAPCLLLEADLHTPLVCSPRILQPKRHLHIAEATKRSDECGGGLLCLYEGYLVII
jgi:hypothetical protein